MRKPSELIVPLADGAETSAVVYPAADPPVGATLVLAHGAGAGQHSAFMTAFAQALAGLGVDVVTFDFKYMHDRRRIPDRGPILEACYRSVVDIVRMHVPSSRAALFIGGKSMGGRIASQIAAGDPQLPIAGLVLLGYPLHPPGKPAERRDKHLPAVRRPMFFEQGERDAFGTPAQLAPVLETLDPAPDLRVVADADHSFKLPGKDPAAQAAVFANIQQDVVGWIRSVASRQS